MTMRANAALAAATLILLVATGCAAEPVVTPTVEPAEPSAEPSALEIENVWSAPGSVIETAIPLGDGNFSTTSPAVGSILSCEPANPDAPGAQVVGPWIQGDVWDLTQKVVVQGEVSWPAAAFSVTTDDSSRIIVTNNLPTEQLTGVFPIAATDPAAQFDRNPNAISDSANFVFTLPLSPTDSASPSCLTMGAIGVLLNGVVLFSAVDARGDDAVAHEAQDVCQGHPERLGHYHYHQVPSCLLVNATGPSTVVGWAVDGYPIVVERDSDGLLPTNADLDECHGRTSPILIDGVIETRYHYSATLEYPYTVGCFKAPATAIG